jgi:hypothetical protein
MRQVGGRARAGRAGAGGRRAGGPGQGGGRGGRRVRAGLVSEPAPALAAARRDGTVRLWNAKDLKHVKTITLPLPSVVPERVSSQRPASASTLSGQRARDRSAAAAGLWATCSAYMPLSQKLAVGSFSRCVAIYDLASYELAGQARRGAGWGREGGGGGGQAAVRVVPEKPLKHPPCPARRADPAHRVRAAVPGRVGAAARQGQRAGGAGRRRRLGAAVREWGGGGAEGGRRHKGPAAVSSPVAAHRCGPQDVRFSAKPDATEAPLGGGLAKGGGAKPAAGGGTVGPERMQERPRWRYRHHTDWVMAVK